MNTTRNRPVEHRLLAIAPTVPGAQPDTNGLVNDGEFLAKAMVYSVIDSYGTDFAPGVFNDSLTNNPLPPVLWSHNSTQAPTNVLGRLVDWSDTPAALLVVGQLDPVNPHYDLVRSQLATKTMIGVSVGFIRQADEPSAVNPDGTTITKATLCELSLVVEPSVPGAQVLAVRSRRNRLRPRNILDDVDEVMRDRGYRTR
jgi:HK97 family phage prohead protease